MKNQHVRSTEIILKSNVEEEYVDVWIVMEIKYVTVHLVKLKKKIKINLPVNNDNR